MLVKDNSIYTLVVSLCGSSIKLIKLVQLIVFITENIMLFIFTGVTDYRPSVIQKVKEFLNFYLCNKEKLLEIDEL